MVRMICFVKLINSYKLWFIKINGRQLKYENRHHCEDFSARVAIRLCISVLISSDFIPGKPICTSTQMELKTVSASLKKLAPESRHRVLSIGPITFKHRIFFYPEACFKRGRIAVHCCSASFYLVAYVSRFQLTAYTTGGVLGALHRVDMWLEKRR